MAPWAPTRRGGRSTVVVPSLPGAWLEGWPVGRRGRCGVVGVVGCRSGRTVKSQSNGPGACGGVGRVGLGDWLGGFRGWWTFHCAHQPPLAHASLPLCTPAFHCAHQPSTATHPPPWACTATTGFQRQHTSHNRLAQPRRAFTGLDGQQPRRAFNGLDGQQQPRCWWGVKNTV